MLARLNEFIGETVDETRLTYASLLRETATSSTADISADTYPPIYMTYHMISHMTPHMISHMIVVS